MVGTHPGRDDEVTLIRSDRARSLRALHEVERRAGAAGKARPSEWRDDVLLALDELSSSLYGQYQRSASEGGLLSKLTSEAPHLTPSVNDLRNRQTRLLGEIDDLRQSLADLARSLDVTAKRSKIAELAAEIRELRAWETDLVYEAYDLDLGVGD